MKKEIKILKNFKNEYSWKLKRKSRWNINKEITKFPEIFISDLLIFNSIFPNKCSLPKKVLYKDLKHFATKIDKWYSKENFSKYPNFINDNQWILKYQKIEDIFEIDKKILKEKEKKNLFKEKIPVQGKIDTIDILVSIKNKNTLIIEYLWVHYKRNIGHQFL